MGGHWRKGAKIPVPPCGGLLMLSMTRQHAWTGLVAGGALVAALSEGLFEPLAYAAAAVLVWSVVAVCLIGRVFEIRLIGKPAVLAGLLLAAIAALTLLSTTWATDQGRAFELGVRAGLYAGFFVLAACTAGENARRHWIAGLAIGVAITGFISLFAYLHPGTLESGRSPIANAAGRLTYPIGYWNGAASLFAMGAVLLAFCAANAATRHTRSLATAAIPALGVAIWLTGSRGALVAIGIGCVVLLMATRSRARVLKPMVLGGVMTVALVLISARLPDLTSGSLGAARRSAGDWMTLWVVLATAATAGIAWATDGWLPRLRVSRRLSMAMLATLIVGAAIAIVAIDPVEKSRDFTAAPAAHARPRAGVNSHGRWQFWKSAGDAFASSPLRGIGAGSWEAYWGQHSTLRAYARNPHSLPMQSAAELGLPGIALLLGFAVVIIVAAWRRLGAGTRGEAPALVGVLGAAAVGAATDWTWQIPAVIGPALVCAGLLTATAPPRVRGRSEWLEWPSVAFAWLAIAASALVLIGDIELRRSLAAADAGRTDEAIARARDAVTFEPWSAAPYLQLALRRQRQADYPRALADLRQAQARDTDDWRLFFVEARLQSEYGDGAAAAAAFKRVLITSPYFAGSRPR